jgi:RimJ/RimL family protein N-acetyltransferase
VDIAPELISTARLDLVPLSAVHAEEMATVLSSPALHTFIGGEPLTPDALRTRYERLVAGSSVPSVTWCNWVLRLHAESCLVGTVQATVTGGGSVVEIAWVVGLPWQGRGLATEAARGLVSWLAHKPSVRTVVAHIHPKHGASAAVATAVGLTPSEQSQDDEVRWHRAMRP